MFFDALGRFALGQATTASSAVILVARAGSFALTGTAIALNTAQPSSGGVDALSGVSTSFKVGEAAAFGTYLQSGVAASLNVATGATAGAYIVSGNATLFTEGEIAQGTSYALAPQAPLPLIIGLPPAVGRYGVVPAIESFTQTPAGLDALGHLALGQMSNATPTFGAAIAINMPVAGTAYAITPGPLNALVRTGADFDLVYGGVGHYLEEIERARQLAKITRKTPAPIVHEIGPRLRPMPSAPSAQPAIDLRAVAAMRPAQQPAQAEQAQILKRRRQEAEILLLAS